jgi:hypothetical protein
MYICVYVRICMYMCIYICVYVYVCVHICVCMCAYMCVYIYIDANLLTTRLAVHTLRAVRYSIKIRATVCYHLVPLTHSCQYFILFG